MARNYHSVENACSNKNVSFQFTLENVRACYFRNCLVQAVPSFSLSTGKIAFTSAEWSTVPNGEFWPVILLHLLTPQFWHHTMSVLHDQILHKFWKFCMKFGHLILRKIFKFVATKYQILRLECTKFDIGCGSPKPH